MAIHQEDTTIIHAHAPKNSSREYMKQQLKELKEEIQNLKTMVRDLNIPFSITDRTTTQNY